MQLRVDATYLLPPVLAICDRVHELHHTNLPDSQNWQAELTHPMYRRSERYSQSLGELILSVGILLRLDDITFQQRVREGLVRGGRICWSAAIQWLFVPWRWLYDRVVYSGAGHRGSRGSRRFRRHQMGRSCLKPLFPASLLWTMDRRPEAHCRRRGFENDMSGIRRAKSGLNRVSFIVGV